MEIARYIREHSATDDRVAVVGSEHFSLAGVLTKIGQVVFVSATRSWIARPGSDQTIFGWFEAYQRGFIRVGVADIVSPQETVYRWGDAAGGYAPRSDVWLMVFERARPR